MKNKKRIILIILIVINIIVLIYMVGAPRNKLAIKENKDEKVYTGSIEYNKKIYPANHYEYEKLFQKVDNYKEVYSYLYKLVYNISALNSETKNLTEAELKNYYIEKEDSIKSDYLIYKYEDYKLLVDKCKKIEDKKYKIINVLTDSFNKSNNSINANFVIEYDNISLKININVDETNENAEIKMKPLSEV